MSGVNAPTSKSGVVWKVTAVVFIVLTIGASGAAYYYYSQNQDNILRAKENNYLSQWQADETRISSLGAQITSDQNQIQSLNSQISQLQNSAYHPSCAPNCDATIATLNSEITGLHAQIINDQTTISSLQAQIATDRAILGLTDKIALASSTTYNWVACGGSGQPSCNGMDTVVIPTWSAPSGTVFYAGYLSINWTSTSNLQLVVINSPFTPSGTTGSSSATTLVAISPSSSSETLSQVIIGWQIAEPPCSVDLFGNHSCPSGTVTYSITYYY